MKTISFYNRRASLPCCVCGLKIVLGNDNYYPSNRQSNGLQYLDGSWYVLCSPGCDQKFDLTPLLFKPIPQDLYR